MLRLDVLLARNLGWSRSAARAAIAEGQIRSPDGTPWDASRKVAPDELPLAVVVDDEPQLLFDVARVVLNKPLGCVTALRDVRNPTAYALLRGAPLFEELRPVGRLDLDTSGLLFWTTDGQEIQRLTHPKRAVPRIYQAALAGPFQAPPADFVLDDGHRPQISDLAPLSRTDAHPSLAIPDDARELATVTITGGAYHEVRRIFAALGSHVLGLCRVRFGDFVLPPDLPPGAFRLVSSDNRIQP